MPATPNDSGSNNSDHDDTTASKNDNDDDDDDDDDDHDDDHDGDGDGSEESGAPSAEQDGRLGEEHDHSEPENYDAGNLLGPENLEIGVASSRRLQMEVTDAGRSGPFWFEHGLDEN